MNLVRVTRAMPAMFRVGMAELVAYRAEMVIWILTATMPLIMLALWNTVVADAPVAGFGPTEISRYFAATLVVRQLTSAWVLWHLNWLIRTGGLSARLLRPVNPLVYEGVTMLAALPIRLLVVAPMMIGLVLWQPELLTWPGLDAMALFSLSVLLAWLMTFMVQGLFGMVAFWTDQSEGMFGVWFSVWMLLSGYIAPLAMFPEPLQAVFAWLPFRGMIAVPVELLGGFLAPRDALFDIGVQVTWVVVLSTAATVTWRRGVRRYGAFGA